jgi:hypothetical protein
MSIVNDHQPPFVQEVIMLCFDEHEFSPLPGGPSVKELPGERF